jgi:O-methyltransferase involved in polyketide biosynthesis
VTNPYVEPPSRSGIDTTVPHSARIWNYWLGGKDNYAVDRAAGDAWLAVHPEMRALARATRAFLGRAVHHLAQDQGVRQFIDVGTGLPSADNTHEVAQRVAPEARIVYVDNDPLVLAHARVLLTSSPQGATQYIDADMRDTATVLARAGELLDFTQPIALLFMGVLGHVADYGEARALVSTLVDALPSGSFLVVCDGSEDDAILKAEREYAESGAVPYVNRSSAQVAGFFEGLEWVDPGLVPVTRWRPALTEGVVSISGGHVEPEEISAFAGVARKP